MFLVQEGLSSPGQLRSAEGTSPRLAWRRSIARPGGSGHRASPRPARGTAGRHEGRRQWPRRRPAARRDGAAAGRALSRRHQRANGWQGSLRFAPLDLDAMHARIAADLGDAVGTCIAVAPSLAVTCLDQADMVPFRRGGRDGSVRRQPSRPWRWRGSAGRRAPPASAPGASMSATTPRRGAVAWPSRHRGRMLRRVGQFAVRPGAERRGQSRSREETRCPA